jgi:hypothetical protein
MLTCPEDASLNHSLSIVVAIAVVIAVLAVPFAVIPIVVIAVLSGIAIMIVATVRCNDATG